ncbi:hypothetical protein [Mesoterricola silvestris]|uniref:DUF2007 domain-containing protein n=1 Tax=Mesoterricola silvestris TaxID=2927979 RepID=A0AA48HA92_9BACT|nr:hypothetical protein [Mesoterricola silvestris]BDU74613.1 hypothetical protein METEAL_37870 [Mesoterricola silvestris]
MKAVHEAINLREGNLIAVYLCEKGVPAEVRGGAHHSVRGELYNIRGLLPEVWVLDDADAPRAKAFVQDYLELLRKAPEGEPWTCPACGEVLEPQFQSCWKCQGERQA